VENALGAGGLGAEIGLPGVAVLDGAGREKGGGESGVKGLSVCVVVVVWLKALGDGGSWKG
jgi:hypothetical protein